MSDERDRSSDERPALRGLPGGQEPKEKGARPSLRTHQAVSERLCGTPLELREGYARVGLETLEEMRADASGLVHGGFVFGLADFAAMLAVNDPNVVLGSARMRFLKPVVVGERLEAEAEISGQDGMKKLVQVEVRRGGERVASGELLCFTPGRHVLGGDDSSERDV